MAPRSWRAVAELAASQHGVVTRSQAAANGIGRKRVQTAIAQGRVVEPMRGVLVLAGTPATWRQRVMIVVLLTGGVASGLTAAALHRLEGLEHTDRIEVTVTRGGRRSAPGAVVRSSRCWPPGHVTVVDGIPVFSKARTLAELGRDVDDDAVEQALDGLLRAGVSLQWITRTHRQVDRPGASGTDALARVLALPDRQGVVNESFRERVTERLLTCGELGSIERQHEVHDADGTVLARLDLAIVDCRLGIEYHSDQWHYGPRRGRGDRRRDLALAARGWEVVYLDASDHESPAAAVEAIQAVVRGRRAECQPGQTIDCISL